MKMNTVKICFASLLAGIMVLTGCSGSGSSITKNTSGTGVTVIEFSHETESSSGVNSNPVSAAENDEKFEDGTVPDVQNLSKDDAVYRLEECGYIPDVKEEYNPNYDKGIVFLQSPSAHVKLEKGSEVTIIVSLGDEPETASKPEEKSKPSSAEIYASYSQKVDELVKMYGKPLIGNGDLIFNTEYKGLSVVRLIDFDGDGQEELLCGYSCDYNYIDKQEVFEYNNGKVVSLFKGKVNSSQVGYLEIVKKGNKSYLCNGAVFKMPDDEWQWIGIKDHLAYIADNNKSFMDGEETTMIYTDYRTGIDTISQTLSVFKIIGYNCEGVIDEAEYQEQTEKYEKYLKDNYGDIVSRVPSPTGSHVGELDKIIKLYYDFDNNGILEMWFFATESKPLNYDMSKSLFCTINNGKVEELLNDSTSGGTYGGKKVTLTYSEHDDSLKIGESSFCGGWGGVNYEQVNYNYSNGKLEKCYEDSGSFPNNGQSECTINGKTVSQTEYNNYKEKLHNLFIENAIKVLYFTPPSTPVYERLKLLNIIKEHSAQS